MASCSPDDAGDQGGVASSERFALRLTRPQAARWREVAREHGVSLSELVREAVAFFAEHAPVGYIERRRAEALAALAALISTAKGSVRTRPAAAPGGQGDAGDPGGTSPTPSEWGKSPIAADSDRAEAASGAPPADAR